MPYNSYTGEYYDVTSRGTNDYGNRWDNRVTENGQRGYHYSNQDGSYYYKNPDGSRYYKSRDGYSRHTSTSGKVTQKFGSK
ncbi:hypothetical protein L226DRAFT_535136 [Lentinus tigrinus ALCF2SS1-7]|uniref:uncharacterized protein n=1 Tax=Lentinus tigrinus ALCF2SS1-7 TaxID=1328758 RepID=UPI0011662187|nr:hypothetical protein L226DRAFT_535136 [Lentinus tigrinus ALCF2SS1-7]